MEWFCCHQRPSYSFMITWSVSSFKNFLLFPSPCYSYLKKFTKHLSHPTPDFCLLLSFSYCFSSYWNLKQLFFTPKKMDTDCVLPKGNPLRNLEKIHIIGKGPFPQWSRVESNKVTFKWLKNHSRNQPLEGPYSYTQPVAELQCVKRSSEHSSPKNYNVYVAQMSFWTNRYFSLEQLDTFEIRQSDKGCSRWGVFHGFESVFHPSLPLSSSN